MHCLFNAKALEAAVTVLAVLGFIFTSSATPINPNLNARYNMGQMTILGICDFDIWYQFCDDTCVQHSPGQYDPNGFAYSYSAWPAINGSAGKLTIKFGRGGDSPGITMLETSWDINTNTVTYALSETENAGTSPFLAEGYVMWPIPVSTDNYPTCNGIHCGKGESSCADAYQTGEFEEDLLSGCTYTNFDAGDGEPASKQHECPDVTTLYHQFCSG